ncbi:MAG: histidine phosphatase family protein [Thermosynechococcus sp. Uc]|uniref:histidine phosphatase family protein n=1 Tax=Thermosynechococcus sp. Uc TaxID=3034853 RepID=UPI00259E7ACF|nr:histidine phosphatase family protein [Thermosynechococcus sp. Uc]MDM7325624.1 histidine phosphatase family protein [Thermosynechococcus sp. Uc]
MRLILIRHGEAVGNASKVMLGRQDVPLTERGRQQALALREKLPPPNAIYTSPLQRCRDTATLMNPCPDLKIQELAELIEIDQGIFTGLTWAQAQAQHPDLCAELEESDYLIPVPEAESMAMAWQRAKQAWKKLRRHSDEDCVWCVSHGGFLQCLISVVLGSDRLWGIEIPPAAWFDFSVRVDLDGRFEAENIHWWRINTFNGCP